MNIYYTIIQVKINVKNSIKYYLLRKIYNNYFILFLVKGRENRA
ncbi:MAG: hypothetical protein S4CHLAM37_08290 [Chlamydiia bacterium]|nr:hypothetical protein [Chlamydiia bacterium]